MDLFKAFKTKQKGLPSSMEWTFTQGLWVPLDTKDSTYIEKGYKAIPIIQSIVSKIIDKASDAPPQVMRIRNERVAKGFYLTIKNAKSPEQVFKAKALAKKAFEQQDSHPFLNVIDTPNPINTGKELRESLMGYYLLTGNAIEYAAMPQNGSNSNRPTELWCIPSPCVKPVAGNLQNPIAAYAISYMSDKNIDVRQITHVKNFNPITNLNGLEGMGWGLSPLRSAGSLMTQRKYADIAQGTLFANMAPAGIISGNSSEVGLELEQDQAISMNDHFRNNHMGVHNAGDIHVTPADVKWVNIGLSPVDMDILNFNKDIERQIANIYNWPVNLLYENSVQANQETSARQIITNCVMPLLRRFDDARTKKLRQWYNDPNLVYLSDLQYYSELSEDREQQARWLKDAYWLTTAEKREMMDYESEVDESQILVPSGLMPLSDVRGGSGLLGSGEGDF